MRRNNGTRTALFTVGFLSIGTQFYLLREFMTVFSDNELMAGLVLSLWMVLTGMGALLGGCGKRRDQSHIMAILLVLLVMLPPAMIPAAGQIRATFFPPGVATGPLPVVLTAVVIQAPFCLLSGFLFTGLSITNKRLSPGTSYAWESAGSLLSGALVNFLLIPLTDSRQGVIIIAGLSVVTLAVYLFIAFRPVVASLYLGTAIVLTSLSVLAGLLFLSDAALFPGQEILIRRETPYGRITITRNAGQVNYFENQLLLCSSGNEMSAEEDVHYAMSQHPHPSRVLLISGGYSGTLQEILKYRPASIDYVEPDPGLLNIASRYSPAGCNPVIHFCRDDGRRFLRTTTHRYDVVLVNVPPPASLLLNRFYSDEFVEDLRRVCTPGSVAAWRLPAGSDYLGKEGSRLHAVLYHTLQKYFRNVLILPGLQNYFLASDRTLSADIPRLVEARSVETVFVNRYYLDAGQLLERSDYLRIAIDRAIKEDPAGVDNTDLRPVALWRQMSWWMVFHGIRFPIVLALCCAVLLIPLFTLNRVSAGIGAAGFSLAATEVFLIFAFQVMAGNLFRMIGVIIMCMMAGLASGASGVIPVPPSRQQFTYGFLQAMMALVMPAIPAILYLLHLGRPNEPVLYTSFLLMAFIPAFLAGLQYRIGSGLRILNRRKTVSGNYSADLFGAAAGAFSTAIILVPVTGILVGGALLALLNGAALLLFLFGKRF